MENEITGDVNEVKLEAKWTTPPVAPKVAAAPKANVNVNFSKANIKDVKLNPSEVNMDTSFSSEGLVPEIAESPEQSDLSPRPDASPFELKESSIDPSFLEPSTDIPTPRSPSEPLKEERGQVAPNTPFDAPEDPSAPLDTPRSDALGERPSIDAPTGTSAPNSTEPPAPTSPADANKPSKPPLDSKAPAPDGKPSLGAGNKAPDSDKSKGQNWSKPQEPSKPSTPKSGTPKPNSPSPTPKASPAAQGSSPVSSAKNMMARDPNAGQGGRAAKAAGAVGGIKGALDGFNQGGFKGAALKGAAGAKQASSDFNAKAAAGQSGKTQGKAQTAKNLAGSGIKAAIIAWLVSTTGVPPAVWAKVLSKQGLIAIGVIVMVPVLVVVGFLTALGPTVDTPSADSDKQANHYLSYGWQDLLKEAARATRRENVPVPWTVLGGIAAATTNFGKTSPYDNADHDPTRSADVLDFNSDVPQDSAYAPGVFAAGPNCDVTAPSPVIGGGEDQAKGPFLLKNSAWKAFEDEEGGDANNACDVAEWLALKLSKTADDLLESDTSLVSPWKNSDAPEGAERDAQIQQNADFWAKVIASSNLIEDPTSGAAGGGCMVTTSADAANYPVEYLIERIWNCEISNGDAPALVSHQQVLDNGTSTFETVPASLAAVTLIQEAYGVSYAFSGWSNANCTNSADVAGIFPLDKVTAEAYGALDRCDPQQNIRAAARAVLSVERTAPASRVTTSGPYQPMLGGWLKLTNVFGKDLDSMLSKGPESSWRSNMACDDAVSKYLQGVAPKASSFANIASETDPSMDKWSGVLSSAEVTGNTLNDVRNACTGASDGDFYDLLSNQASDLASKYETEEGSASTVAVSASVYSGLSYFFGLRSSNTAANLPTASYGENAVVGLRLSNDTSTVSFPSLESSALSQPITSIGQKSSEYAVFFGGVDPAFDTVGLRIGSLALSGTFNGLNSNDIPSYLIPWILKYGNKPPITPALLAAQLKAESSFNPNAKSSAGAEGMAQFMPSTWASEGIDANGDGKADPYDPEDAIASQASYMSKLYEQVKNSGLPGDPIALTLASYNAGFGAVKAAGGIPSISETQNYVTKIQDMAVAYSTPPSAASTSIVGLNVTGGGPGAWGGYSNGRIPSSALKALSWSGGGDYLRCDAARAVEGLNAKYASEHGGRNLGINDSYRSYDRQVTMKALKGGMAATPGTSNHGWGLALDIQVGSQSSETYRWLTVNGPAYGWINSEWAMNPAHREPWHWEYQGAWPGSC